MLVNQCVGNQNSYIDLLLIRVVATKKDQKNKQQKAKPKKPEVSKDLSGVRVIQRKMAYVIGLPLSLADENVSFSILVSHSLYCLVHFDWNFCSFSHLSNFFLCVCGLRSFYSGRSFLASMEKFQRFPYPGRPVGLFSNLLTKLVVCKFRLAQPK